MSNAMDDYRYLVYTDKPNQIYEDSDAVLPSVTPSDNGKVLKVVDGTWTAAELPSASGVNF